MIAFEGLRTDFVAKVLNISKNLALMDDFLEGFIQYIEKLSAIDPSARKTSYNLIDFANYIKVGNYEEKEIENIKDYITLVYEYKGYKLE